MSAAPRHRDGVRHRASAPIVALGVAIVVAIGVSLAGCAVRPVVAPPVARPAPPVATPPESAPAPTPGTTVGTTASGGVITTNPPAPVAPAGVDSTPSEEALAVLRTIPEPLGKSGNLDSVRVPVPSPTQPLGDREGARATAALPESVSAPPTSPPRAAPGVAAPAAPTSSPDSCWRVQVLAPPERDRADRMAEAARSQLLIPFVIERESGLFKVRTRDCMSGAAANDLRRRAMESGFTGAFRFRAKPR